MAEVTQLENEYRLLTDFKLSPNATPVASAHVSPAQSDCESEGENATEMEGAPPVSSAQPVSSEESAATGAQDLPESTRPRRSMPPDGGLQSSQPLLHNNVLLFLSSCGRERDAALNCDRVSLKSQCNAWR